MVCHACIKQHWPSLVHRSCLSQGQLSLVASGSLSGCSADLHEVGWAHIQWSDQCIAWSACCHREANCQECTFRLCRCCSRYHLPLLYSCVESWNTYLSFVTQQCYQHVMTYHSHELIKGDFLHGELCFRICCRCSFFAVFRMLSCLPCCVMRQSNASSADTGIMCRRPPAGILSCVMGGALCLLCRV